MTQPANVHNTDQLWRPVMHQQRSQIGCGSTGAATGIRRAVCRPFADRGAAIVTVDLDEHRHRWNGRGGHAH
jgi:hypothetical protein